MGNLYTIVIDYKGGTYTSQYYAQNISLLKEKWIMYELIALSKIAEFSSYETRIIKRKITDEKEINLEGLQNVWNNDIGFIKNNYFSMIIIKTCVDN
ncbi:hypothetical protein [Apibacter sp. HY039]|uniref:hypothetical protein n=1 Tax=Apibacter sp. HY039 TaxID=2501476 RepID=UPI000FEB5DEF|nr:hypothetical protein [Apibacter sp. HY039]